MAAVLAWKEKEVAVPPFAWPAEKIQTPGVVSKLGFVLVRFPVPLTTRLKELWDTMVELVRLNENPPTVHKGVTGVDGLNV